MRLNVVKRAVFMYVRSWAVYATDFCASLFFPQWSDEHGDWWNPNKKKRCKQMWETRELCEFPSSEPASEFIRCGLVFLDIWVSSNENSFLLLMRYEFFFVLRNRFTRIRINQCRTKQNKKSMGRGLWSAKICRYGVRWRVRWIEMCIAHAACAININSCTLHCSQQILLLFQRS